MPGSEGIEERDRGWTAFDGIAGFYDEWFGTPLGTLVDALEKEALLKLAVPAPGETVLDVGCGTGNFTVELARRDARTLGVEPSPRMLALARRKGAAQGLSVEFAAGFAEHLPFASQTFDLVTCVTALEFMGSPQSAVAEMARILKPGGRLVVGALSTWSLWALARRREKQENIYSHAHFFTPLELAALLRPYGKVTWRSVVFVPSSYTHPNPRIAQAVESFGRVFLWPFGAFLAARMIKG